MSYPCTDTSVNSLAELPQGELVIRLLIQAGWDVLRKQDDRGIIIEQDSLEDILNRVVQRKQFLRKTGG